MKQVPYEQMIAGLDRLLFNNRITNESMAKVYADVIEVYLKDCGWSFDDILQYMVKEKEGPNELAN